MGRRLLLVEDSSTMRFLIASMLQEQGYEVDQAADGREALELASRRAPELILTDYEMPHLDGPGLCRALKADPALRSVPVLMLTVHAEAASKVLGLDAGADDYLAKPSSPDDTAEMFARIRAQFRLADLRGELASRNRDLERAHARIEADLDLTRKLASAFLPAPPGPRGPVKAAVRTRMAQHIGGGVLHWASRPGPRLALLLGDVPGRTQQAALLSWALKARASALMAEDLGPSALLAALDDVAARYFPRDYSASAAALLIDEATGAFLLAGAGAPTALRLSPSGAVPLGGGGPGTDLGSGSDRAEVSGSLAPGEMILLHSPALPEALAASPSEAMGLLASLATPRGGDRPEDILDRLDRALEARHPSGSAPDDLHLVILALGP